MVEASKACIGCSVLLVVVLAVAIGLVWALHDDEDSSTQPVTPTLPSPSQCQADGGVVSAGAEFCYVTPSDLKSWDDAEADCVSRQGHLASILNNPDQLSAQSAAFPSMSTRDSVWIGLNDKATEGTFVWSDNSDATSLFQAVLDDDASSDCVALITNSSGLYWQAQACSDLRPYLCKLNLAQPPSQVPIGTASPFNDQGQPKATVTYTRVSDPDASSPVTGYIATSTPGGKTGTAAAGASQVVVDDLQFDVQYSFTVRAENRVGLSVVSDSSNNITIERAAPGAPSITNVRGGNRQLEVLFQPTHDGGSPILTYSVSAEASVNGTVFNATGPSSPILLSDLVAGDTYIVTMTATNAIGASVVSTFANNPVALDETLPLAPTSVTTDTTGVFQGATVSWSVPEDNGTTPLVNYTITAYPQSTGVERQFSASATDTSLVVQFLGGISYRFTVAATNQGGTGVESDLSALTPIQAQEPWKVLNVTAELLNSTILVSFETPPDPDACNCRGTGGSPIIKYIVHSNSTDCPSSSQAAEVSGSPATVGGLEAGCNYTFRVSAVNEEGGSEFSDASNSLLTPETVPGAVQLLVATAGITQVNITWDAPAQDGGRTINGYEVVTQPGGVTVILNDTFLLVSSLPIDIVHNFTVRARNALGFGPPQVASATPFATEPGAPTQFNATVGPQQVLVSFEKPSANGSPILGYYATATLKAGGGASINISVVGEDNTLIVYTSSDVNPVNGLSYDSLYDFTVRAQNSIGFGPEAGVPIAGCCSPQRRNPDAPVNLNATVLVDDTVIVCADAPTNNGGSPILFFNFTERTLGLETASCVNETGCCVTIGPFTTGVYDFVATCSNAIGESPASVESNSIAISGTTTVSESNSNTAQVAGAVLLSSAMIGVLVVTVVMYRRKLYCFGAGSAGAAKATASTAELADVDKDY